MIVFQGNISDECKKQRTKVESRVGLITALIPSIVLAIFIAIATIKWDWIFVIGFPVLITFVLVAYFYPKREAKLIVPYQVCITDSELQSEGEKFFEKRKILWIKKIIDKGEWYQIVFYFPHKSTRFICQKNLLVEGTIEEFEELFQGKIIRKTTK